MADRKGLDGTMLHYLAIQQAMVSIHRSVHLKTMLTFSFTWQTDCCTSRRMASKAPRLLDYSRPSPSFLSLALLKHLFKKLSKHDFMYCQIEQLCAWAHPRSTYAQLSPLYLLSTLCVTHVIDYSRPSPSFLYYR